jgi:hypothetical protein
MVLLDSPPRAQSSSFICFCGWMSVDEWMDDEDERCDDEMMGFDG